MSLLDSVIGALGPSHGAPGGGQGDLLGTLVGMLGQSGGAAGGLGGLGGLAGLVTKFQQGGLGDIVGSWVGSGQNLPVSADQVSGVLGNDTIAQLAQKLGLGHGEVAGQLSQMLPQLVDKLTPHGQLPAAGAAGGEQGGMGDLAGMLGGLSGMLKR